MIPGMCFFLNTTNLNWKIKMKNEYKGIEIISVRAARS